jgi:hypothetical protein
MIKRCLPSKINRTQYRVSFSRFALAIDNHYLKCLICGVK